MFSGAIPGIILTDIIGRVVESDGIRFVCSRFKFEPKHQGRPRSSLMQFPAAVQLISESLGGSEFSITKSNIWAISRIVELFGLDPVVGVLEWEPFLNHCFIAIAQPLCGDDVRVLPFVCIGTEEKGPMIVFRSSDRDTEQKRRTALAFWSAMLREPKRISSVDFLWRTHDKYCGTDDWFHSRLSNGVLTSEQVDLDSDEEDSHFVSYWHPAGLPCLECSGSGEESFCPAGEVCEFCDGTGFAI